MRQTLDSIRSGSLLALAAVLALPIAVRAQEPKGEETSFSAVIGGQHWNDVGALGLARFEKYREVPKGAVLEFSRFQWAPADKHWQLSLTAFDALQRDQRYFLDWSDPARFSFKLTYRQLPRYYGAAATTFWNGAGTGTLTLSSNIRQPIEAAAGDPLAPLASDPLKAVMAELLATSAQPVDLRYDRKATNGELSLKAGEALTFTLTGRYEEREGTKPLSVGTYVRRQALAGIPGTGAGSFWRETIEPRGHELVEPLTYKIPELNLSLAWSRKGHSAVVGWEGSYFRSDITRLYFDNPFEAVLGRASASIFDPNSDQEPAAPNGNNQLRGLYSRSAIQLWPENSFNQLYGNGAFKLGSRTRFTTALAYGRMTQNEPFMPYSDSDQVVFSGVAGQPGVVLARDAALSRASLDGEINTTRADFKLTSRPSDAVSLRLGYRWYGYDDKSAHIVFPGYTSSSDSFFRRSIGQRDASGARSLFNEVGGYTRRRLNAGAALRLDQVTFDGEYVRTAWDYDVRQVERTSEDSVRASLRWQAPSGAQVGARYRWSRRDSEGPYAVGLEASGVRAYDLWKRDRNEIGSEIQVPFAGDAWSLNLGGSYWKDEYPGAIQGFTQPYGLQDSRGTSLFGGLSFSKTEWSFGAWAGWDGYEWNSLQVTKSSLGADYLPTNRWTRASKDDTFWVGLDVSGDLGKSLGLRADFDYQKFSGDWLTENQAAPDINSAVAYAFPELADSLFTGRLSLVWKLNPKTEIEARYLYEPYRLDDFTWDVVQAYPQGVLKQTQSSAASVGDANVSRVLWLNNRYSDYDAHVLSLFLHLRF